MATKPTTPKAKAAAPATLTKKVAGARAPAKTVTKVKTPEAEKTTPKKAARKRPVMGRPTVYDPEMVAAVSVWTEQGYTLQMIAEQLGVVKSTVSKWMNEHADFSDAITRARRPADSRVIESLHRRANGYEYFEQHPIKMKNADGSERIELVEVRKHMAPDVNAQRYWANNRFRDQWKNVPIETDPDSEAAPITSINWVVVDATVPKEATGAEEVPNA